MKNKEERLKIEKEIKKLSQRNKDTLWREQKEKREREKKERNRAIRLEREKKEREKKERKEVDVDQEMIDLIKEVNQEEKEKIIDENITIKELAMNILSARKAVKDSRDCLAAKKIELSKAKIDNLKKATFRPPVSPEDLTDLNNEIVSIEAFLEAEKKYYFELDKFARATYPKIFKRQKK